MRSVRAMGGDPTIPDIPLMVKPVTGNDIFRPRAPAPTPATPVDNDTFHPDVPTPTNSPTPVRSLPCFITPHYVQDDDFPADTTEPNTIEHAPLPPQPSEFPDYPLMEMPDSDEDEGDVQDPHEIDLDEFMDLEFLQQGNYSSLSKLCCIGA